MPAKDTALYWKTKLTLLLLTFSILLLTPIRLLASPSEPERYDPVEYFNQSANNYEMVEKAKELTGLLEDRMEHLIKLKLNNQKGPSNENASSSAALLVC